MERKIRLLIVFTFLALIIGLPLCAQSQRLRVSENGKFLATYNGEAVFLNGDTGWNFAIKFTREEIGSYLKVRKWQKFNAVGIAALFEENKSNVYGDQPFGKTGDKWDPDKILSHEGNNPLDSVAYDYWDHLDYALDEIEKHEMYAVFVICFNSMIVGDGQGNQRDLIVFDENVAYRYGRWIGNRYRDRKNIIWMMGGDRSPIYGEFDYRPVYHAMAEGVADGINGGKERDGQADNSGILMSFHPQKPNPASSSWFQDAEWLSFNSIQACPSEQVSLIQNDLTLKPQKPTWLFEGRYEHYTYAWKAYQMRFQAYHSIMSGGFGHVYGNTYIWQGEKGWQNHLYDPGAMDMSHLFNFFSGELIWGTFSPFDKLLSMEDKGHVEDICWFGQDRKAPGSNLIQAMRSEDKKKAVIYSANGRSFHVDTNFLQGDSAMYFWYDPRTGMWFDPEKKEESMQKTFFREPEKLTNAQIEFDPPGEPGFDNDWILLIESY